VSARGIALIVLLACVAGGSRATAGDGGPPSGTPGDSVYQLTDAFQDQRGAEARLDVFRGHPVLMSMFYASCTDTCPLLIAELHRIEASLAPALRADLRVILVSLDPARDTPSALGRLADTHRIDAARWRLLRGTDDSVRDVAAVLGVKFRRLSKGTIDHSTVIAVLDRRGVVESRIEGITPGDPRRLARVTEALARVSGRASR
jgi:protein SCO1